jgi:Ala-tRNA(Pro) deacylase
MSVVTNYLEARGVPYELIHYHPSSTSLAEAPALGVDADVVLKAIVIDTQGRRVVALIPASRRLDMHRVREALDDPDAHLATEDELQGDFPSIELSGGPVLGLLDATTLVQSCVLGRDTVLFAAGTRTDSVRVRTSDLFRGEHPAFVSIASEQEKSEEMSSR